MDYIEEKALEAQEHFENLLMFVKNNSDKDANYMEKEIFSKLLQLGNSLMNIYVSSVGTGDVGKCYQHKSIPHPAKKFTRTFQKKFSMSDT